MSKTVQRVAVKAIMVHHGKVLLLRKAQYEGNAGNQGNEHDTYAWIKPSLVGKYEILAPEDVVITENASDILAS